MYADHVICLNCEKEMYVHIGTEICPRCGEKGTFSWVNKFCPEVDVPESLIEKTTNKE